MTDDERLGHLLRRSIPPISVARPARDLWPQLVNRSQVSVRWSWLDLTLLAVVAIVLLMRPDWLWLVAYQL